MSSKELNMTTRGRLLWRSALLAVLAALCAAVGIASSGAVRLVGLLGAVAILGALALVLATRPRPAVLVLVAIGALPIGVLTWTSLVTPIIATLCLVIGWPLGGHALRRQHAARIRSDGVERAARLSSEARSTSTGT